MIDDERCYARIADLPEPDTSLLIVVPPEKAVGVIADAARTASVTWW
jgi:predicted CoA-binding protein